MVDVDAARGGWGCSLGKRGEPLQGRDRRDPGRRGPGEETTPIQLAHRRQSIAAVLTGRHGWGQLRS